MTAYARQFPTGACVAVEDENDVVHRAMVRFDFGVGHYFALNCASSRVLIRMPRAREDSAINCFGCLTNPWRFR